MTQSNDNRTHIYRIRRKSDGLFLEWVTRIPSCYGEWGPTGVFWKKPETIRKHLLELCTYRMYCGEEGYVHDRNSRRFVRKPPKTQEKFLQIWPAGTQLHTVAVIYDWLDKYEVVATEISVHGQDTMEARDFALFKEDLEGNLAKA